MSYNGSGVFNINTAGQPVVTGTVISSTSFNALTADLGTGLSTALTKNGQTTVTANIPFNGFKLTGIGVATASGDALTYGQAATVTTLVASTSITDSGLTSGRVTYAGTAGLLQDSANLTFNGTTLTANTIGAFTLGGTVAGGGNNINNVIIGASSPLAGAFTTLSADNNTVLASAGNTKTVQIGSLSAPANVGTLQQTFNGASVWGGQTTVGGETDFGWNFYYYGGFKSRLADVASRLSFNATSGRVSFWTAPSPGSADAALTFTEALRIDATTGVTALGAMAVGNGLAVTGTLSATGDANLCKTSGNITAGFASSGGTLKLDIYDSALTSTTIGANRVARIGSNVSGGDCTLQFTDSVVYNSYISAKANHIYIQPATSGTYVADFSSTGLAVTGTLSSTGAIKSTGANLANEADCVKLSFEGTSASAINAYGTDASTAGSFSIYSKSSNGSVSGAIISGKAAQTLALEGASRTTGTGIAFPATQSASTDANTLDDYEEGTWTPSLTSFTVVGSPTYTGFYTKVGRQVTVVMQLTATTIASSGSSFVNNLPFSQGVTSVGSMATMTDNSGSGSASNGYISGSSYYPGTTSATQYKYLTATYFTS